MLKRWTRWMLTVPMLALALGCGEQRVAPVTQDSDDVEITGGGERWSPAVDVFLRDGIAESDSGGVKDYSIVRVDGVYHVFYIHNPRRGWQTWPEPGEDRFGHATSRTLLHWTLKDPIDLREETYSATNIWAPHVIEADGVFYMFYTGVNWSQDPGPAYNTQRILLATNDDLDDDDGWVLHDGTGLILDGPADVEWSSWGDGGAWADDCRDPFVIKDGGQYVMFVSVRQEPVPPAETGLMVLARATANALEGPWEWQGIMPETEQGTGPGWHGAESANVTKYGPHYYLLWTDDVLRAAVSTSIMGTYSEIDASPLYGYANEVLRESHQIIYGAIVGDFELQFKKLFLSAGTPSVTIHAFNQDDFPRAPPVHPSDTLGG